MTRAKKKAETSESEVRRDATGRELYDHEVDPPAPESLETPEVAVDQGEVEQEVPAQPSVAVEPGSPSWQPSEEHPQPSE